MIGASADWIVVSS